MPKTWREVLRWGNKGLGPPTVRQYLCPNCNAQEDAHAGWNKGRTIYDDAGRGSAHIRTPGRPERDIRMMAEPSEVRAKIIPANLTIRRRGGKP